MKYKFEEKTKILEEYKTSGLSVVDFCKNKKLAVSTLKIWLKSERATFLKTVTSKDVQNYEKSVYA